MGYDFKSRIEQEVGKQLIALEIDFTYEETQYEYTVKVPTSFCGECSSRNILSTRTYTPDFYLPDNKIIIECKGRFTAQERKKHAAFKEQHPDEDLRILFQRDNYLTKNRKRSYVSWCKSKNIDCAVGMQLPKEWLPL